MKTGLMGFGKFSFYYLLYCHKKKDVFSFLGFFPRKSNEDRFIFNIYSFILLIVERFLRKKI